MEFTAYEREAAGLPVKCAIVRADGSARTQGTFASMFVAAEHLGSPLDAAAFKVFSSRSYDRSARREYSTLVRLGGLYGYAPKALAYGYSRHLSVPLPTIVECRAPGVSARGLASDRIVDEGDVFDAAVVADVISWFRAMAFTALLLSSRTTSHGDLSFNNVFLSEGENGDCRAVFIDFGSSDDKVEGGATRPATPFFTPPENQPDRYKSKRNTLESADVYAIGALALYLWFRPTQQSDGAFFRAFTNPRQLLDHAKHDLPKSPDPSPAGVLLQVIEQCICDEEDSRLATSSLKEILDYLDPLQEQRIAKPRVGGDSYGKSVEMAQSLLFRRQFISPRNLAEMRELDKYLVNPMDRLYGRKKEIELIDMMLSKENGDGIAFVHGIGGIGKTALALGYARLTAEGRTEGSDQIKKAFLVRVEKDVRTTLCGIGRGVAAALGINNPSDRQSGEYAMSAIRSYFDDRTLLILDNLDAEGESLGRLYANDPYIEELIGAGARYTSYKVIVTSRNEPCEQLVKYQIPVGPLDVADLRELFTEASNGVVPGDALIDSIAKGSGGNAYVVKLKARLMASGSGSHGVGNQPDNVGCFGDAANGEVASLLRLADLGKDENSLLAKACLLPAGGFSFEVLSDAYESSGRSMTTAFSLLRNKGWMELDAGGNKLQIHPLVREACLGFIEGKEFCMEGMRLLDELWEVALRALDDGDRNILDEVERAYGSTVDSLGGRDGLASTLFGNEGLPEGFWWMICMRQAWLLRALGRSSAECNCLESMQALYGKTRPYRTHDQLRRVERDEERDPELWGSLLHDCARVQGEMGRYGDAIKTINAGLEVLGWDVGREQGNVDRLVQRLNVDGGEQIEKAIVIAHLLARRGYSEYDQATSAGLEKALWDKQSALRIMEAAGAADWDVASVLYTLAYSEHITPGMMDKAIGHAKSSVELLRRCVGNPPENHTERDVWLLLATTLNFLGLFYCGVNGAPPEAPDRLSESLSLKEEALSIRYKYLGHVHMDIARSHNNISFSLRALGRTDEALEHALISAKIRRLRFPDDSGKTRGMLDRNLTVLKNTLGLSDKDLDDRLSDTKIPKAFVPCRSES